ncbi:ankyrin repeat and fibronectin type-III domain-containing protein 1 [Grus japonensis]|uniref:Ankyrin repeat and fibronectin type-III domain-containing protein 1 n=1 Tax=Grus japonensis TaxID=30415 RepID=A0ABC9XJ18_GRUJA
MHNLSLLQTKKNSVPSSPNAAKRLYRNLSEKLKGSHTSFDEAYFRARSDRLSLRKTSMNFQCNEAMFEAVEQQDLDAVQILLYQYTLEELDLNTPNSEGLTPLDIAILTNNVPIARTLLHVGAKESPHFVNMESRSVHLSTLVQEAQQRVTELSAQVMNEGLGTDNTEKEKQLKAWEWRYRLYKRMKAGYEHARAPEAPTNVCLMVTSSTSLTVTFQEPLSVNSAVVTKYKVEWSSSEDFSPLVGEIIMDNLQSLRCTITGLRTTGKTAVEENLGTGDTLRPWNVSFSRFEQLISIIIAEAKHFRLYTQEVLELGHNVSFLLLLPASDDVCTAPGQNNPYTPHSGFLNLPLQMFELVHFCCYKEKFISLYCRLSAVIELDSLKTQQSLREAISDSEVAAAKQRHQQVIDYIQQIDEIWRKMRWITEALQYARYKQPAAGLPIKKLVDLSEEHSQKKISSTSSHIDCLPSPPPSPEARIQRRKAVTDSQPCSDEEGCSEVFLPTDSDYDSSDALSPRELDLIYSSSHDISQQAGSGLGGSAPDVLQVHDMKPCLTLKEGLAEHSAFDTNAEYCTEYMSNLTMSGLTSKSIDKSSSSKQPLSFLGKKKLGKHQHYNYFSRHHRWLRVHSETQSGSLSEGVYTQHLMRSSDLSQEPTSSEQLKIPIDGSRSTFLPHASSLPEDGKGKYEESRQDVHRIHVEPYKATFLGEEGTSWAMSTQSVEHSDVHNAMQQIMGPDDQSGSAVSEVFSSTL